MRKIGLGLGGIILVMVLAYWMVANGATDAKYLPSFSLESMAGSNMNETVLQDGGVITFFRSTCGYCLLEYPMWKKIRQKYPNIKMVMVLHKQSLSKIKPFFNVHGNPFNHVLADDENQLWDALDATYTPETFVYDKSGTLVGHFGYIRDDGKALDNTLKSLT
ncbi:TlpA family protein disulfide reductase [Candidatus Synchoanobacter obligatus]|uniref:TlpA family protein disulfide reductase n=1 Tax=Candidatus Synchoanobacter obligatus TaxID=2919597 RepID=A0ABT1L3C7_9GAMM|nr:TlpA family protein disulfide reductase [Candidatus Synchoanobacter obligatus]